MSFNYDSFSEDCARKVSGMIEETYDFQRCERPNGTFYGTGGSCRKGSPAGDKEEAARKRRTPKKQTKKVAEVSSTTASAVKAALKKNPQNKPLFQAIRDAQKEKSSVDSERSRIASALTRKNVADVPGKKKKMRELDRAWGAADLKEAKARRALNDKVRLLMEDAKNNAPKPKGEAKKKAAEKVAARREKAQNDSERLENVKREISAAMRGNRARGPKWRETEQKRLEIASRRAERNSRK